jgi:hypothetical protein
MLLIAKGLEVAFVGTVENALSPFNLRRILKLALWLGAAHIICSRASAFVCR